MSKKQKVKETLKEIKARVQKMPLLTVLERLNDIDNISTCELSELVDKIESSYPFDSFFHRIDELEATIDKLITDFKEHRHCNGKIVKEM